MSNNSPSNAAPDYGPEQEIRFAVVMYGGVSLAIYINGVAQELFRMVRGTANLPKDQSIRGTEEVYRNLGRLLSLRRQPGENHGEPPTFSADAPVRSRFVVDILSGSSAGGINALFLAKGLALKVNDLDLLKKTWLKDAHLDVLLNDQGSDLKKYPSGATKASLLNSERMYGMLLEKLTEMNKQAGSEKAPALADNIDLFITATDLNGLETPIQLTDKEICERIHKKVFHFEYVAPSAAVASGAAGSATNHFTPGYDPMLAFAARCTSSFPLAFEPMTFEKIKTQLEQLSRQGVIPFAEAKRQSENFFRRYIAQGDDFAKRAFADGGYLDNRPFSHAIDTIEYRASRRPVKRKLLFVDPFPELAGVHTKKNAEDISFVENLRLAATDLPRYETIREDIERINANNRTLDRLDALLKRADKDWEEEERREAARRAADDGAESGEKKEKPRRPDNYPDLFLDSMISIYGRSYATYHHQRVYAATDFLAEALTRLAGYNHKSDDYYFMRRLTRAWRDETYSAYRGVDAVVPKKSENAFLSVFDLDFRMRRLNHLHGFIDDLLRGKDGRPDGEKRELSEKDREILLAAWTNIDDQLAELRGLKACETLQSSDVFDVKPEVPDKQSATLLHQKMASLKSKLEAKDDNDRDAKWKILSKLDFKERVKAATDVYKRFKVEIDDVIGLIENRIRPVVERHDEQAFNRQEEMRKVGDPGWLETLTTEYYTFDWRDMLSFPFLQGSPTREYTGIEVFRVSPADSALLPTRITDGDPQNGGRKLAGTAVGAFGGFMDREWRANDIMWGRLDGAERIISALLPDPEDKDLRERYVKDAQAIILEEELTSEKSSVLFNWFAEQLRKEVTPGMGAGELVRKTDELMKRFEQWPGLQDILRSKNFRSFIEQYYELPKGPAADVALGWMSRSSKILGQMIDDLPDKSPEAGKEVLKRAGSALKKSSSLITHVVRFALPHTIGQHLAEHWLMLLALGSVILLVAAPILGVEGVAHIGYVVLAVSLLLWLLLREFGWGLQWRQWIRRRVRFAVIVVLGLLCGLGVYTVIGWLGDHPFMIAEALQMAWSEVTDLFDRLRPGAGPPS